MPKDQPLQFDVTFESQESFELFKVYAAAYNECKISHSELCNILKHSAEYKEGIKRMLLKLKNSGDGSLKS